MQAGVQAWVHRLTGDGRRIREFSPSVLLSILCAAAFSPLLAVGAGITGAAAVAGIGVLSSVGGGALSGVLTAALERIRADGKGAGPASPELEEQLARRLAEALAAGDVESAALRTEIAGVLARIDVGGTALRAAIKEGDEQIHGDVIAIFGRLDTGFDELGFLLRDVRLAAADIQQTLDRQGAGILANLDETTRQSLDIRLVREQLAIVERRSRGGGLEAGPAGDGIPPRWAHGCPYQGLEPFDEAHAEVFYGRERLTTELTVELTRKLSQPGLIVVSGASGAGKSSLLRAGLLPALAKGQQVTGSQHWARRVMTPDRHPLTELAIALAALTDDKNPVPLRDGLTRNPAEAHLMIRAILADSGRRDQRPSLSASEARLVLVVDQFEQVFTLSSGAAGEAERRAFITALCAAALNRSGPGGHPPALVVLAVRGDFCDRCADHRELAQALHDGQFVVSPMSESDLRRTVTGPAEAAGLHVEAALTDTILADLRAAERRDIAGALPLLSQAMLLTWNEREGDLLTVRGYGAAGGVELAVQRTADAAYDALPSSQQLLTRPILRSMTITSRGGRLSRRPVTRDELYTAHPAAGQGGVDAVLEAFASRRLIILNDHSAQISHDALLSAWPRLRGWLAEDQASMVLYSQLAEHAATWQDSKADPSFLYRGAQLAAVRQATRTWAADPARYPALTETERGFLNESEHAASRSNRQRRLLAATLGVLLIASLLGGGLAVVAARRATSQRDQAASGLLAAESEESDNSDPVTASLLAAAAWRISRTAQATESMFDAFAQPEHAVLRQVRPAVNTGLSTASFSPDGRVIAAAGGDTARMWNVATHRQIGKPIKVSGPDGIAEVRFSPSGQVLAIAGGDGTARLWNVITHHQIGSAMKASTVGGVLGLAFSPNGKVLATAGFDGTARLWNLTTHQQIGKAIAVTTSGGNEFGLAFSPNGRVLATVGLGGLLQLWNVSTHRQIGSAMKASAFGGAGSVAFSPNGKLLATAGYDGTARLWSVASHHPVGTRMKVSGATGMNGVAFSPDGQVLAADADGTIGLWNVATQQPVAGQPLTVPGGYAQLIGVAYSPGGTTIAAAGADGTVRLWDVAIDRAAAPSLAAAGIVNGIAFSPHSRLLATAGADGTARLWDPAAGRKSASLCGRPPRRLAGCSAWRSALTASSSPPVAWKARSSSGAWPPISRSSQPSPPMVTRTVSPSARMASSSPSREAMRSACGPRPATSSPAGPSTSRPSTWPSARAAS